MEDSFEYNPDIAINQFNALFGNVQVNNDNWLLYEINATIANHNLATLVIGWVYVMLIGLLCVFQVSFTRILFFAVPPLLLIKPCITAYYRKALKQLKAVADRANFTAGLMLYEQILGPVTEDNKESVREFVRSHIYNNEN